MKYIDKIYKFIFAAPFEIAGPPMMEIAGIIPFLYLANAIYGDGTDAAQSLIFGGFLWGHITRRWTDGIGNRFKRINEERNKSK